MTLENGNLKTSEANAKLDKHYEIATTERRIQKLWITKEHYNGVYGFNFKDNKKPIFAIDTPPPFTSGILHMGHFYWCSISDLIGRYKRMRGYNVLLPQGWDCQGLPTELKVQYKWKIPRENRMLFKSKCIEWTEEMIKDMKDVMLKGGYRPDWEAFEYRTMDPNYQKFVQKSLIQMFKEGDIYIDTFPNMWCTYCGTSIAQAETGYLLKKGYLNWIKFPLANDKTKYLEIATTRPELIPACQAIFVHPKDVRFKEFLGKKVITPIFNKEIPILTDIEVDMKFGSGAVMNCTFGDEQDIKWQQRHKLPITSVISSDGKIINTGLRYDGLKINDAQKEIVMDLNNDGFLIKQEKIEHRVLCHTERGDCETPLEFLTTKQFLIKIKKYTNDLIKACKQMKWHPHFYQKRALDWINALEWDWIISRQRIFGTPMPFWSCSKCNDIIPPIDVTNFPIDTSLTSPPINKCPKCGSKDIKGTEDTCDCWVDSSLTALMITHWFTDPEFSKKWITNGSNNILRLQGHDIIRTWYTYTTLRTMRLTKGLLPFGNVLINGHVLGPDGLRMSKSRGNVVDPRDNIDKYGADTIRQTVLGVKVGTDFPFQWDKAQYGKSFLQKLWSVSRFISTYFDNIPKITPKYSPIDIWILAEFEKARSEITKTMDKYEFYTSLKIIQEFTWNKLCDNYLESVKPILRSDDPIRSSTVRLILKEILWGVIRILAPFCPHITEEIYQKIFKNEIGKISIHAVGWPSKDKRKLALYEINIGERLIEIISLIRQEKANNRIALNEPVNKIKLTIPKEEIKDIERYKELINLPMHISELILNQGEKLEISLLEN